MTRTIFIKKILTVCILFGISHSLTRPPAPTITSASYADGKIIIEGNMDSAEQCHAVLLTDLSASLINAYESGSNSEGTVVSYASTTFPISVSLGSQTIERYFVAVATSKLEDKKRVFSPWKIYTDTTGLPIAITTSQVDKRENLISRARNIDAKNPNKVLIDFTFSLKTATASSCRFELKQGSNVLLSLSNMGPIAGAKTDLINAMNDTTGIGDSLIIVSTSGSNNLYRIYQLADYSLPGDIIATIVDNNGLVIDTMDRTVGTYSDDGYMDIFSTISALARMPDGSNNPFYPTSIPTANDSTKLNLLIAAMLDLSIAHNSPLPESNEQKQGIQTNYMQFMDNIAGNWGTLRTATRGIGRLRAIHARVLEQNKGEIIDPVYVVNYGTSFEPHTVTQKRKNYAFIEGFSRINWNYEMPAYGTAQAGTGIMFRVSENIELYRAFIKNSFPTFDTVSFLSGAAARRLIVPTNDTLINKFVSKNGGVWVKGIPEADDVQFYTGIIPVRLPITGLHNPLIKTDTAFTLTTEAVGNGDPVGKIVDCERSVLGVYAISNQGDRIDTLENIEEPGVLLHGQKRKLVYNTKYSTGDRVEFSVLTKGEDTGKVFIESKLTGNTAILTDTSVTVNNWLALATVFANGMAIQSIGSEGTTRRLGFKDVFNSNLEVWCDNIVALAMERDDNKLIKNKDRRKIEIAIRTTNGVKLYTSSSKSEQITAGLLKAKVEGDKWITSWENYEDVF